MAGFSSRDYINALSRRLHAVYPNSQAAAGAVSSSALSKPLYSAATGSSDYTERSWWDANTDPQSGLGRVIDVVARPLYAVGSILEQSRDTAEYLAKGKTENPHVERLFENDNPLSKINAAFNLTTGAAASGLAGRTKRLPSEVILKDWTDTGDGFNAGRFAAGLGIDIALDPLTYVPVLGVASAIGKAGGRGLLSAQRGISSAGRTIDDAAQVARDIRAPLQIEASGSGRHFSVDTAGEAVEKGTYFPKTTSQNAAYGDLLSGESIVSARSWDTFVKSVTGDVKPYRPGLLNLRRQTKDYPDLDIDVPFRKIESRPAKKKMADLTIDDSVEIRRGVTATRARPNEPLSRWAKRNSDVVIRRAGADGTGEITIGDLLSKAGNLRKDSTEKRLLQGFFQKAQKAVPEGVSAARAIAEAAPGAAARAVAGAEGTVTWGKLRGQALKNWHDTYTQALISQYPEKSLMIQDDLLRLRDAKSIDEANAIVNEMRTRRTASPIYETVYLPEEVRNVMSRPERIARYVDDMPGPAERMPKITGEEVFDPPSPTNLDGDVRQIIEHAAGNMQQWSGRRFDFKWDTGRTRAVTNTPVERSAGSLAVHRESWNLMAQMNAHRALINRAVRIPEIASLKGTKRFRAIKEYVMPRLKQIDDFMRANGVEPALTQQTQGYPVSLYDVLNAIEKTTVPKVGKRGKQLASGNIGQSLVERRIWDGIGRSRHGKVKGYRGTVDVDDLQLAVQHILDSLFTGARHGKGGGPVAKSVEEALEASRKIDADRIKSIIGREGKTTDPALAGRGITTQTSRGERTVSATEAAIVRNEVAEVLLSESFIRNIWDAVTRNSVARGIRVGQETAKLSEGALRRVMNAINDPSATIGDMVGAIKNAPRNIDDAAKEAGALSDSVRNAKAQFAEDVSRTVEPHEMRMLDAVSDVEKLERRAAELINQGLKPSEVARRLNPARIKQGEEVHKAAAAEGMGKLSPKDIVSAGDVTEAAQYTSVFRKFFPSDSKVYRAVHKTAERFIPHYGHATIHPAMVTSNTLGRLLMVPWLENLNALQRAVSAAGDEGIDLARSAMKMIQSGRPRAELPEKMHAIYDEMSSMMNMLFETSTQSSSSLGAFMRNGFDFEHINEAIARAAARANRSGNLHSADISDWARFDVQAAVAEAKRTGGNVYEILGNQWRSWDIDDPMNFLAQMRHAMHIVSVESSTVQEAYRIARAKGFISSKPGKDFVKIDWPEEASTFGKYTPPNTYVHKDIVSEFRQMDKILQESRVMTSDFGKWINGNFLPIQNIWKSGMTILRPGHHMRNLVGDLSLVGLAEGFRALKPEYTYRAIRMMGMRGRYDGWDYLKALQGEEFSLAGKAHGRLNPIANDEVVVKTVINGKQVGITAEQLHTGLLKGGVFPEFKHLEDLLDSYGGTKISDIEKRFQQSKPINIAGRLSEARDDYVRIMHAMVYLENKTHRHKFKTLDEALEAAAHQVRKWHPDGSDLTSFEAKYMRTIFPFYSWTRKAVPLVIESLLMNPARVMVWPKATYHVAKANGIDVNTLADPFPTDQLFPSFLTDQPTGPVYMSGEGDYFGINPGIASMDVLRETLSDPWRKGVMGNLTPGIKAPIELMTRRSLSTGAEIHDPLEFVDSQLPLVTSLAGTTGYSVTGSIASLLQGQGLDEQRAVQKGNKDLFDRTAFLNYLFGTGIIDMSKESYINIAEIEKRDKAARELRKIRGE